MKELAVCVSNDNRGKTFYETVDAIVNANFKNVFIQWYDKDFDVSQEEQLKYIRSCGLNVIFAHLGYDGINNIWLDGEEGERLVKKYLRNLDECKSNGIDMVMMHIVVGFNTPEINDLGLSRFKRICDYARELGIRVAFENTKTHGYQERLINEFSETGICFDCGHYHCHFKDELDFNLFKDRIYCVHIHDNYGEFDDHLIPFEGTLDFNKVIDALILCNYNSYLTLESCMAKAKYHDMSCDEFYKKLYDAGVKLLDLYNERKNKNE